MHPLELQRTSTDCGVAALRAVLQFFGIKASYRTIYKLAETSRINGTDSSNILRVLEYYKLSFEVRQSSNAKEAYQQLRDSQHVNILCWDSYDHWVVKIASVGDMNVIFDPEIGTLILTRRQVMRRWLTSKGPTYSIGVWRMTV
jgi:ABC-type bacteriocin/lantibiotic exporter with double-glycine peptidase domain